MNPRERPQPFNPVLDIEPPQFDTDDEEDEDEDFEMGRVPNKPINDEPESKQEEDGWDYGTVDTGFSDGDDWEDDD